MGILAQCPTIFINSLHFHPIESKYEYSSLKNNPLIFLPYRKTFPTSLPILFRPSIPIRIPPSFQSPQPLPSIPPYLPFLPPQQIPNPLFRFGYVSNISAAVQWAVIEYSIQIMEKKKLLEMLPKGYRAPEPSLFTNEFQTTQGDPSTTVVAKLYDRSIVIFTNTGKAEPWGRIDFHFDLIFELVRGATQEERSKRSGVPSGLKFQVGEDVCYLFSGNAQVLKAWRDTLAQKINQRGFHELFKPIKKIGKGNFASVYLAIRLQDERKFAIKAFSKEATYGEDKGKESLINEIELMRKFNHKNLMRLFEVYESDNSIYVSVELLEGGQLYDKIKNKHKFTVEQIQVTVRGLLMGLAHMHELRCMHRDLKPENILLRKDGDYDCVIADFGLSTWADQPEYLFVRCGTPGYVAPEIVNLKDLKAKCDPICDIFSLGIIFHILLLGKSPFPGKTYNQVLSQNRACNFNFQSQDYQSLPAITLDLLKRMLQKNPHTRISAKQALLHPFIGNHIQMSSTVMQQELVPFHHKQPANKTSIMGGIGSPLMTSADPKRKRPELLKDDSCLKFKMKESVMNGRVEEYESSALDSPQLKKSLGAGGGGGGVGHKESQFANRRLFAPQ